MADYLVPPAGSSMVKCHRCGGLYLPDLDKTQDDGDFEPCPFCKCNSNNFRHTIPIWKYNLIKWFRSGRKVDDYPDGRKPEPRILSKDEAKKLKVDDSLWVEDKHLGLFAATVSFNTPTSIYFVNMPKEKYFSTYNKEWRLWNKKPPKDLCRKTHWIKNDVINRIYII